jgi:hypothetical protein
MNINNITSFYQIDIIKQNSLIVCDIDETILKFDIITPNWWKNTFHYYYSLSSNYDVADAETLACWTEYIKTNNPIATDYNGLIYLFDKANILNSNIIFVTARLPTLIDTTNQHLKFININPDKYNFNIYHIGDKPKGEFLKSYIKNNNYDNIVFIDDLDYNLQSVYENLGEKVCLYKFSFA